MARFIARGGQSWSTVRLVVDEWCNTLADIEAFVAARAADVIHVKTPDLGGIGKLFLQAGRRPGLEKLAEAGAGVREPPRGNFNLKAVQRLQRAIADFAFAHPYLPRHRRV